MKRDYTPCADDAGVTAGCWLLVPAGPAAAGGATAGPAATEVPLSGTGGIAVNGENAGASASTAAIDVAADAGAPDTEGTPDSTGTAAAAVLAGTSATDPVGAACTAAAGALAGTSADGTDDAGATAVASGAAGVAGAEPPASPTVAAGAEAAEAAEAALPASGCAVVSAWLGALIAPSTPCSTVCSGEALAASVRAYSDAPPVMRFTNC